MEPMTKAQLNSLLEQVLSARDELTLARHRYEELHTQFWNEIQQQYTRGE